MKIVYCINGTFNSGGMERVLANKANYLSEQGNEVTIITTDQQENTPFYYFHPKIQHLDLGINYNANNNQGFLNKAWNYPKKQSLHKRRLTLKLQEIRPQMCISMYGNEVSFLWNIHDGSSKILEIHFSRFKRLLYNRKGLFRLADKWLTHRDYRLVKKYKKFIVLTNEDREDWGDLPHIEVIPNFVTEFDTTSKANLETPRVLAVGRYDFQKGFDMLIEAWKHVHVNHPSWQLDIIGNGELKEDYQALISKYGLSESVTLKPATSSIAHEYVNSSILAMSSRYEGLPMVLLEAMSMGVPPVSFACKCGPKDIIQSGYNGILVTPNDISALASSLMTLIADVDKRKQLGHEAIKTATNFSKNVVMKKWLELFESVSSSMK